MKNASAAFGEAWRLQCLQLADQAATPGGQRLCEHLQPLWEPLQLQQLQLQVKEMHALLQLARLDTALAHQASSPQWLKQLQPGPPAQQALLKFFNSLQSWRQLLQQHARESPHLLKLGQALQPEGKLAETLQQPHPPQNIWQQIQKKAGGWQAQQALLDQLDALVARARLAQQQPKSVWPHQGKLNLPDWQPPLLDQLPPFDLTLPPTCRVVLLSGAHQSGKSRLLQSLYLAALAHQSGLALPCGPQASLPVFVRLQLLEAGQNLNQRLTQLKPWLQVRPQPQLLLVDDFLTHSSPGEHQALGLAVIQQLKAQPQGLSILSCHDRGLIQKARRWPEVAVLGLEREGPRHKARLQLHWGQEQKASLLLQARDAQWPSQVLQAAETEMQQLKAGLPVVKVPVAAPKKPVSTQSAPPLKPIHRDVPIGARVYLTQLRQYGDLLSAPDRKNRVSVSCEGKTLTVPADHVVLSSHRKEKKGDTGGLSIQTWSVASESCDLHGMRVDEALPLMEKFLDTAAHQGLPQVRIIHGKGTSALQRAVQTRLSELQQQTDYIVSYRFGLTGEGDTGLTVVRLQS